MWQYVHTKKSCRIALKCEGTVANEVWEEKYMKMEGKNRFMTNWKK